jgi:hypothetical protein
MSDFDMHFDGSIVMFAPISDEAKQWFYVHLGEDPLMFGNWYCVEHRYANDILDELLDRGFVATQ